MNRSEEVNELALSLAKAQGQIKSAPKDARVGGKISYKYATLDSIWEVCRKPLSDNDLAIIQLPSNENGNLTLETILMHSSGQWISSKLVLPEVSGRMSELQSMGSALTYARRYMLGAIIGVTTGDDDDGQAAVTDQRNTSDSGMSLDKLLVNLNKVERIKGFFESPKAIMACRKKGATPPPADDMDGWRQLFVDARDWAFEHFDRTAEDGKISLLAFGQVEPRHPTDEAEAVQSATDEIEAENEIPF